MSLILLKNFIYTTLKIIRFGMGAALKNVTADKYLQMIYEKKIVNCILLFAERHI